MYVTENIIKYCLSISNKLGFVEKRYLRMKKTFFCRLLHNRDGVLFDNKKFVHKFGSCEEKEKKKGDNPIKAIYS